MKNRLVLGEFAGVELEANPEASYLRATSELVSLEKEYVRQGNLVKTAQVAQALAECLRRTGDAQGAEEQSKIALLFYQETQNLGGLAWTEWHLGTSFRQRGLYEQALVHLKKAYRLAREASDNRCAVYAFAGVAETHRIRGNYAIALPQHFRLLRAFTSLMDLRGIAWAYEGIGQMQKNQEKLGDALNSFELARRIAAGSGDIRGLGWALKGVGEVRSLLGQTGEGRDSLLAALRIFQDSGARIPQAYTQKVLGDSFTRDGKVDPGARRYIAAAELFASTNDERGMAYVLIGLGDLHWKLGLRDEAVSVYGVASKIFLAHRLQYGLSLCATRFERAGLGAIIETDLSSNVGGLLQELLRMLPGMSLMVNLQGAIDRSLSQPNRGAENFIWT